MPESPSPRKASRFSNASRRRRTRLSGAGERNGLDDQDTFHVKGRFAGFDCSGISEYNLDATYGSLCGRRVRRARAYYAFFSVDS